MSHVIILAKNTAQGNAYAREHRDDLPRGRYTVPTSARQIEGVVPHLVIELPGFTRRPDRHAILAAVKRSTKRYQDCEWVVVGEEDPRGPLTERQIVVAHRYNALLDAGIPENVDPVIAMASVEFTPEDLVAEEADGTPEDDQTLTPAQMEEIDRQISDAVDAERAEQGTKRRRSKCPKCETLHFKGDPCPLPADDFIIG